ncbi:MAG TPA: hypothetical protein PKJ75_08105 [Methanosarcina vacuolata]|nr:hypothetical protein [Methanosarcina vacuolata]
MKVTLKYNMGTYSGTLNDMIYSNYRDGAVCIGRKYVKPAETSQQTALGTVAQNLATIYKTIDPAYIEDLKDYATAYGKQISPRDQIPPTAYAIWIKMMYAWRKSDVEHVFLETVTLADIVSMEAPIVSIQGAIEGGLLPDVTNSELLDSPIDGV